jgi:hypothetical protein
MEVAREGRWVRSSVTPLWAGGRGRRIGEFAVAEVVGLFAGLDEPGALVGASLRRS